MRIPSSINYNTLKTYELPTQFMRYSENVTIQSYNFKTWDANLPKTLQTLSIEIIAANWTGEYINVYINIRYLHLDKYFCSFIIYKESQLRPCNISVRDSIFNISYQIGIRTSNIT